MERRFVNPILEVHCARNRLPHKQQDGITYFVTFRLGDSLPSNLMDQWRSEREQWLKFHPEPWNERTEMEYHKQFTSRIEGWLDDGHGSCLLREEPHRACVESVLMRFDGLRCLHHSWVIMPNHVHALFSLEKGEALEAMLKAWKGTSSRDVNRLRRMEGSLWMKDYFDRMIRDAQHFWRCARYIRNNPVKARLSQGAFTLYESEHVSGVLDGTACG